MTKFVEVPLTTQAVVDDPGSMVPPHPVRYKVPMTVLGSMEILFGTILFINGCLLLSEHGNNTSFFFGPPFALIAVAGGVTAIFAVKKQTTSKIRFTFIATLLLGFVVFVSCLVSSILLIQLGVRISKNESDLIANRDHSMVYTDTTHIPHPEVTTLSTVDKMAFFISSGVLYILLGLTALGIIILASINLCAVKYVSVPLSIVPAK